MTTIAGIKELLKELHGTERMLVVPFMLIRRLGSIEGAALLNQIVYWSDGKSNLGKGKFSHSYPEWEKELGLSEYIVKKWCEVFIGYGFLQVTVENVAGKLRTIYHFDYDKYIDWLIGQTSRPSDTTEKEKPTDKKSSPSSKSKEKEEVEKELDAMWESIPGVPKVDRPIMGMKTVNRWAHQYRVLDKAPDHIKWLAMLVYQETGFEPEGKLSNVIRQLEKLWSAAGKDERILRAGLRKGEQARQDRGLTMKGPQSYVAFVANERAKQNKKDNTNADTGTGTVVVS